jgi:DnaJ-class molecular chaperone
MTEFQEREMVINKPKEGERYCSICRGTGMASKYDMGWRSLMHDPALAVKRTCTACGGTGIVRA